MSVPWTAPEVIAEQTSGDILSEVWSLGATVYSLLAGHSPFEKTEQGQNTREQLRKRILRANYVPITRADVPPALQQVLEASMRRNPRERYTSALAFAEALRHVEQSMGLPSTPLEVADDVWAAPPVDFANDTARDHVRVQVAAPIARKVRQSTGMRGHQRSEDSEFVPTRNRGSRTAVRIAVGAVALVAVGVTAGIVIAGLF